MKFEDIKDPKLRQRILSEIEASEHTKNSRLRQDHKPLMNKLEQEYYNHFLSHHDGPVCIQSVRFKLANGLWYKPDFFSESMICSSRCGIEVKGPHSFRGGFENLKMAAHQYPWIKWILVWKENGEWQEQTVIP